MNTTDIKIINNLQAQIDEIQYANKYAQNKHLVGKCFYKKSKGGTRTFSCVRSINSEGQLVGNIIHFHHKNKIEILFGFVIIESICDKTIHKSEFDFAFAQAKEVLESL